MTIAIVTEPVNSPSIPLTRVPVRVTKTQTACGDELFYQESLALYLVCPEPLPTHGHRRDQFLDWLIHDSEIPVAQIRALGLADECDDYVRRLWSTPPVVHAPGACRNQNTRHAVWTGYSQQDWHQPLTQSDQEVLVVAERSKSWGHIQALSRCLGQDCLVCGCTGLRDHTRSSHVFALALEILFYTGEGSILCQSQLDQDIVLQTARIVVHLAPGYYRYHRKDWLPLVIAAAIQLKRDTPYEPDKSTGGYYQACYPDGRMRYQVKAVPDLLPLESTTAVALDLMRQDLGLLKWRDQTSQNQAQDRLIALLTRLPLSDPGRYSRVSHQDLQQLWGYASPDKARKFRIRMTEAGLIEEDPNRPSGRGRNLFLRIPDRYQQDVSIRKPLLEYGTVDNNRGVPIDTCCPCVGASPEESRVSIVTGCPPGPAPSKAPWQSKILAGVTRYNRAEGRMQTWTESQSHQQNLTESLPPAVVEPPVIIEDKYWDEFTALAAAGGILLWWEDGEGWLARIRGGGGYPRGFPQIKKRLAQLSPDEVRQLVPSDQVVNYQ